MRLLPKMLAATVMALGAQLSLAAVPIQFITKMYTEALGRAPDQAGWENAIPYFQQNGCSANTVRTWGTAALTSSEFYSLGYDSDALVLVAYRAIFDHEPTPGAYWWAAQLRSGAWTWSSMIAYFFSYADFNNLVPSICSGSYHYDALGLGNLPAQPDAPPPGGVSEPDEAHLQALLYATPAGGTVALQQESVIAITTPLSIPSGVTLTTYGSPSPHQHAFMARLVRAADFQGPVVQLALDTTSSTAALRNVWVDGERTAALSSLSGAVNIEIYGGANIVVDQNFISNTRSWSSLHSFGSLDGRSCAANTVTNNVITVYPSRHNTQAQWADGLSLGCENTTAQYNQIVDPSDVGIVVFNAYPATQRSNVQYNTVVSAGNSAFGAIGFDPLACQTLPDGTQVHCGLPVPSFSGAQLSNNTFWGGQNTHFVIGLAVGSREWFSTGYVGAGANAVNNTTGSIRTNMGEGISVSGMTGATVQGNTFLASPYYNTNCPVGNVFASISALLASGSIQGPYADINLSGCMSDTGGGP